MEGDGHYYRLAVLSTPHFQRPMGMYVVTHLREIISVVRKICDKLSGKQATLVERKASLKATIKKSGYVVRSMFCILWHWLSHWLRVSRKKPCLFFPKVVFVLASIWQQQYYKNTNQQDNSISDGRWGPQPSPRCLLNQDMRWRVGTIQFAVTQFAISLNRLQPWALRFI